MLVMLLLGVLGVWPLWVLLVAAIALTLWECRDQQLSRSQTVAWIAAVLAGHVVAYLVLRVVSAERNRA